MPQLSFKFMSVSIWSFFLKIHIIEVNFRLTKVQVLYQEIQELNGKIECLIKNTV
jgi:hypothetical protein